MATFTIEQILNDPMMQFNNEPYRNDHIDWSMMFYEDWKTPEYWANKYPAGLVKEFPGIWNHFEYLAQNSKSPLEEWEDRRQARENKCDVMLYDSQKS